MNIVYRFANIDDKDAKDIAYVSAKSWYDTYQNIMGIDLAKNFGQHAALMAGFAHVTGDILVCLDDDGQTPANEVYKLLEKIEEGEDVVYAKYDHKKHSLFRNFGSFINEIGDIQNESCVDVIDDLIRQINERVCQ